MSDPYEAGPKRKLEPLNLPKERIEPLVNLLDLKNGSAIMKERAVEVVGNLAEEEIHGPEPTALVQCDAVATVCKLIKEDRSPKTSSARAGRARAAAAAAAGRVAPRAQVRAVRTRAQDPLQEQGPRGGHGPGRRAQVGRQGAH